MTHLPRRALILAAFGVASLPPAAQSRGQSGTAARAPQSVVNELLAADVAFSASAVGKDVAEGLAAMFADEVIMPAGPGRLAKGKADVLAAIRANPVNAGGTLEWAPRGRERGPARFVASGASST